MLICISAESREAVDDMVGKAEAAGGVVDPGPRPDRGFVFGRSFEDPDRAHLGGDVDGCRRGAGRHGRMRDGRGLTHANRDRT